MFKSQWHYKLLELDRLKQCVSHRAANSVGFFIKFELEFSLFYEFEFKFEFSIFILRSLSPVKIIKFFRDYKKK